MNKDIFQLKIIYTDASNKIERKPYRIVQFHKDTNLQQLAQHILKSFGFKMSEPFGFYSDLESWDKSEDKFELFEEDPTKSTLKNTYIDELFDIQKEFLLIYDYLEEHRFLIYFEKNVPERHVTYPDIIESMGERSQLAEATSTLDEDDDDSPRFAAKKKTSSFAEDMEDYDDSDMEGLDGIEGEGYDLDEDPASYKGSDDDFGIDEYGDDFGEDEK